MSSHLNHNLESLSVSSQGASKNILQSRFSIVGYPLGTPGYGPIGNSSRNMDLNQFNSNVLTEYCEYPNYGGGEYLKLNSAQRNYNKTQMTERLSIPFMTIGDQGSP